MVFFFLKTIKKNFKIHAFKFDVLSKQQKIFHAVNSNSKIHVKNDLKCYREIEKSGRFNFFGRAQKQNLLAENVTLWSKKMRKYEKYKS